MKKPLILIDLDGVLNIYCGDYEPNYIPPIREGAKDFIIELSKKYRLKLFTNRNTELAKKWLEEYELDKYFIEVTNIKGAAKLYIDDRALNFNGNFNETLSQIYNFKTFWEK